MTRHDGGPADDLQEEIERVRKLVRERMYANPPKDPADEGEDAEGRPRRRRRLSDLFRDLPL